MRAPFIHSAKLYTGPDSPSGSSLIGTFDCRIVPQYFILSRTGEPVRLHWMTIESHEPASGWDDLWYPRKADRIEFPIGPGVPNYQVWYTDRVTYLGQDYYRCALVDIRDLLPPSSDIICPCCTSDASTDQLDVTMNTTDVPDVDALVVRTYRGRHEDYDDCIWHHTPTTGDGTPYVNLTMRTRGDFIGGGFWVEVPFLEVLDASGGLWYSQSVPQIKPPDYSCSPFSGSIDVPMMEFFTLATGTISLSW